MPSVARASGNLKLGGHSPCDHPGHWQATLAGALPLCVLCSHGARRPVG